MGHWFESSPGSQIPHFKEAWAINNNFLIEGLISFFISRTCIRYPIGFVKEDNLLETNYYSHKEINTTYLCRIIIIKSAEVV